MADVMLFLCDIKVLVGGLTFISNLIFIFSFVFLNYSHGEPVAGIP